MVHGLTLLTSLQALSLNTVTLGVRTSTYKYWGTQFSSQKRGVKREKEIGGKREKESGGWGERAL